MTAQVQVTSATSTTVTLSWNNFLTPAGKTEVALAQDSVIARLADNSIVCWGSNGYGVLASAPTLSNAVEVAAGYYHFLVRKSDGTIVAWGQNSGYQIDYLMSDPWLTNIVSIAAGRGKSYCVKSDGTVKGYNDYAMPTDLTNVSKIAAGGYHAFALKNDGTVVAWGDNSSGQLDIPRSNVAAISAGHNFSLALLMNGSVVASGSNVYGQCNVPAGLNATKISAGYTHCLAVVNGGVVAWGDNSQGQCDVPAGLTGVVQVAAGDVTSAALKSDGTVVMWGFNSSMLNVAPYYEIYRDTTVVKRVSNTETIAGVVDLSPNTSYTFKVQGRLNSITLIDEATVTGSTLLYAPTGVVASHYTYDGFRLNWNNISSAVGYEIEISPSINWFPKNVIQVDAGSTHYDFTNLSDNQYFVRIRAVQVAGTLYGEFSPDLSVARYTTPYNLVANDITTTSCRLSWAGGSPYYEIYVRNNTGEMPAFLKRNDGGDNNPFDMIVSDLTPGATYLFSVRGYGNTNLTSHGSTEIAVTIPMGKLSKPRNLFIGQQNRSQLTLAWAPVENATSYTVQYCTTENGFFTDVIDKISSTMVIVRNLGSGLIVVPTSVPNNIRYYTVIAHNPAYISSDPSTPLMAQCKLDTPSASIATDITSTSVKLYWAPVLDAAEYKIYQNDSLVQTTNEREITVHSLTPYTSYSFKIQASAPGYLSSDFSAPVVVKTKLSPPDNIVASDVTADGALVSWDSVPGAERYSIVKNSSILSETTVPSYYCLLIPGTENTINIQALNGSDKSEFGSTTVRSPLRTPTNLEARAKTPTSFRLQWRDVRLAPSESNVTYEVYKNQQYVDSTAISNWMLISGNPGESALYAVQAKNAENYESAMSDALSVSLLDLLATPSNLHVKNRTSSYIDFEWDEVAGASVYEVRFNGEFALQTGYLTARSSAIPAEEISIQVQAKSGITTEATYSEWSASFTAKSLPAPVANLKQTAATYDSVTVKWLESVCFGIQIFVNGQFHESFSAQTYTKTISGLMPNRVYSIGIRSTDGSGEYSDMVTILARTALATPTIAVSRLQPEENDKIEMIIGRVDGATEYEIYENGILKYTRNSNLIDGTSQSYAASHPELLIINFTPSARYTNYEFAVKAKGKYYDSAMSNIVEYTSLAESPQGLAISNITASSMDLSWEPEPGIIQENFSYKITAYDRLNGTSPLRLRTWTVSGASHNTTVTELIPNYFYQFSVFIIDSTTGDRLSLSSAEQAAWTALSTPTGLSASNVGVTNFTLMWGAVNGATSYEIHRVSPGTLVSSAETNVFEINDLDAATTYTYQVKAKRYNGEQLVNASALSAPLQVTLENLLEAPIELTASNIATTSFDLSWTASVGATSYEIYRNNSLQVVYDTSDTTFKTITNLTPGTSYTFAVKAVGNDNFSPLSDWLDVDMLPKLLAPINIVVNELTATSVTLAWDAVVDATDYEVYQNYGVTPVTIVSGVTSATIPSLSPNSVYRYEVRALNANNYSDKSAALSVRTLLSTPSDLVASKISSRQFDLAWTAVPDATVYIVTKDGVVYGGSTSTSLTIKDLTPETAYLMQVKASSEINSSALSAALSVTTAIALPAPINLVASNIHGTGFDLTWDIVAGATSYNVYRDTVLVGNAVEATFTLSDLEQGIEYSMQVQALDGDNFSDLSEALLVVTVPVVDKVVDLITTEVWGTAIALSWTASANALSYDIYLDGTIVQTVDTTTCEILDLTPATAYEIQIIANGANDNAAEPSDTLSVTTLNFLATPFVTVSSILGKSLKLDWNAPIDATSYEIYQDEVLRETVTENEIAILGLNSSTTYSFAVKALGYRNYSKMSPVLAITTHSRPALISSQLEVAKDIDFQDMALNLSAVDGILSLSSYGITLVEGSYHWRVKYNANATPSRTLGVLAENGEYVVTLNGGSGDSRTLENVTQETEKQWDAPILRGQNQYTWNVTANGMVSDSERNFTTGEQTFIADPTNTGLQFNPDTVEVTLSWAPVDEATGYRILYKIDNFDGAYAGIGLTLDAAGTVAADSPIEVGAGTTSLKLYNLVSLSTYWFFIQAIGTGLESNIVAVGTNVIAAGSANEAGLRAPAKTKYMFGQANKEIQFTWELVD